MWCFAVAYASTLAAWAFVLAAFLAGRSFETLGAVRRCERKSRNQLALMRRSGLIESTLLSLRLGPGARMGEDPTCPLRLEGLMRQAVPGVVRLNISFWVLLPRKRRGRRLLGTRPRRST